MGLSPGMTLLMLVCVQMGPWNRTVVYFFHSLVPSFIHPSSHQPPHSSLGVTLTVCQAWALRQIPTWPLSIESLPSGSFRAVFLKLSTASLPDDAVVGQSCAARVLSSTPGLSP